MLAACLPAPFQLPLLPSAPSLPALSDSIASGSVCILLPAGYGCSGMPAVFVPSLHLHPSSLPHLAPPSSAGYGYGGMLTVELSSLQLAKLFMERLQNKHQFGLMVRGVRVCYDVGG